MVEVWLFRLQFTDQTSHQFEPIILWLSFWNSLRTPRAWRSASWGRPAVVNLWGVPLRICEKLPRKNNQKDLFSDLGKQSQETLPPPVSQQTTTKKCRGDLPRAASRGSAACEQHPRSWAAVIIVLWLLSCPALCDPMDCSPPGSSVHRISKEEYWRGLPFPSPGDLSNPGIEPKSPGLAGGFFTTESLGKPRGVWLRESKWWSFKSISSRGLHLGKPRKRQRCICFSEDVDLGKLCKKRKRKKKKHTHSLQNPILKNMVQKQLTVTVFVCSVHCNFSL